jgi:CubicO group peptidase (beta-lactamase class C family)
MTRWRCWPDPLLFEPGTQHRYSIWGWVLVSAVVQGAAGHPFARVMDREVFDPLAMTSAVVAETADVAHGAGVAPTTPAWRAAHLQRRLPDELRRRERRRGDSTSATGRWRPAGEILRRGVEVPPSLLRLDT